MAAANDEATLLGSCEFPSISLAMLLRAASGAAVAEGATVRPRLPLTVNPGAFVMADANEDAAEGSS